MNNDPFDCQEREAQINSPHASFVLRCWTKSLGEVHTRLVDVRTGNVYPLSELSSIPALIQKLLEPITYTVNDCIGSETAQASSAPSEYFDIQTKEA